MTKRDSPEHQHRGVHDLGGLSAGAVDRHEHTPTLTERRIDALMMLLRERGLLRTDENRRTIESMTPGMYDNTGYYEHWVRSLRSLLVEKGVLSEAEIEARLGAVRERYSARAAAPAVAGNAKTSKAKTRRAETGKTSNRSKATSGAHVKGDRR